MASRQPPQIQEEPQEGVPAWMTTFSDCMMLLLTFFVLLLTFSSFDPVALKQLEGAMKFKDIPSLFDFKHQIDDSIIEINRREIDRTDKGSEVPATDLLEIVRNPRKLDAPADKDAFADERILHMPIDRLFLGDSMVFTSAGRDCLDGIALFLKLMPCKVFVGTADDVDDGILKSLAVLEFFTQKHGFSPARFCLSPDRPRPMSRPGNNSVMQIVLLAKDITSQ